MKKVFQKIFKLGIKDKIMSSTTYRLLRMNQRLTVHHKK